MKYYPVAQQTAAWFKMRAGMPTASCADKILTPKTLQLSAQAVPYRNQLLAEWLLGTPFETEVRVWQMETGLEREEEAAQFFTLTTGLELQEGGFCTDDDGLYGASPDRLTSDGCTLEIKAPTAPTHVGYLLAGELPNDHLLQVQMQLLVVGCPRAHFLSYYPGIPPLLLTVEPIPKVQEALKTALGIFLESLEVGKRRLDEMRNA
jgi:YqaJ-like viral recombinase domain